VSTVPTREEVTEIMAAYEIEHSVDEYFFYDWNVWPLLRVITAYEALWPNTRPAPADEPAPIRQSTLKAALKKVPFVSAIADHALKRLALRRQLADLAETLRVDPEKNDSPCARRDVLLLTLSGRRQHNGKCLYEIYADPIAESFKEMGASTLIWERKKERFPRCHPSAWISRLLELEITTSPTLAPLEQPPWFSQFCGFAESLLQRRVTWVEVESEIRRLQLLSLVYEKWLRKSVPKLLISVCWYDPEVMAATIAARRLGITTVDLQHGLQDNGHFAYAKWKKVPHKPYSVVPDFFWTWGAKNAVRLMAENPAFYRQSKTVVGGNLWFNKWRFEEFVLPDEDTSKLLQRQAPKQKTVLVTLQDFGDYHDFIAETIHRSPVDWRWLVRWHPATPETEREYIRTVMQETAHPGLDIDVANNNSLFSLLKFSDVHVTGHSTSMVEALGFGVPTITVTKNGVNAFKEYMDQGVVLYAQEPGELLQKIMACEDISNDQCMAAAESIFASCETASAGLRQLLESTGGEG
jgi:hypothetical protein